MTTSMTGYGEGTATAEQTTVKVAIRSVNHRHLDITVHLPAAYGSYETRLRAQVARRVARGKVDITVSEMGEAGDDLVFVLNPTLAQSALDALSALERLADMPMVNKAALAARLPGVITAVAKAREGAWGDVVSEAVERALDALTAQRREEGQRLHDALVARLDAMNALLVDVSHEVETAPMRLRDALMARLHEMLGEIDAGHVNEQRLAEEVFYRVEHESIAEEYERLIAHVTAMRALLSDDKAIGKRLDFLAQEMQREANTMAAKAGLTTTPLVLALKHEIEAIREQGQNVE